jgi:dTDP-4-dehydrorhamnose reductase
LQVVRNYLDACQHADLAPATLFFSTDYVFAGTSGQYRSRDAVGPHTVYGATNLLAERLLLASHLPGIVLRVSAVMGKNGGFFQWLERSLADNQAISLFDNTYFSPTSIGRLCRFVTDYAATVQQEVPGRMHVTHLSDGYRLSRYEFGCAVAKRLGKPLSLLQPSQADFTASTFQADLSLVPDGLDEFLDSADWNELENIY